ncbi:hypothetical protein ABZP36_000850 [Zizania latifolia]
MAPAAGPGALVGSAAALAAQEEMRWRQLDSGVSAVSFGFVATAILVSMFLAMAILEHFLRSPARGPGMLATTPIMWMALLHLGFYSRFFNFLLIKMLVKFEMFIGREVWENLNLDYVGRGVDNMPVYAKGVSVLMPGHDVPTFIAHPAPAPCPPERIQWPSHQPTPFAGSSSNPS